MVPMMRGKWWSRICWLYSDRFVFLVAVTPFFLGDRVQFSRIATTRGGERVLEGVAHELGARAEVEDQVVVRVHPRDLTR